MKSAQRLAVVVVVACALLLGTGCASAGRTMAHLGVQSVKAAGALTAHSVKTAASLGVQGVKAAGSLAVGRAQVTTQAARAGVRTADRTANLLLSMAERSQVAAAPPPAAAGARTSGPNSKRAVRSPSKSPVQGKTSEPQS